MSRVFFREELDSVATFWRIFRKDGVTLGFISHDRALWFGGINHRAAPGMVPSAIRRSAGFASDSAEVRGVLSHASIRSADLRAGCYDEAAIEIGAVDWTNLEARVLYHGTLGSIAEDGAAFTAELVSAKSVLQDDTIPRTSPTCRAQFCGPGCGLSSAAFTKEAVVENVDRDANSVRFKGIDPTPYVYGTIRWLDGSHAGLTYSVIGSEDAALVCDVPLSLDLTTGTRAILREGCDHVFATCAGRFGNSVNFQGEPFLPGNDLLARYPLA